MTKKKNKNQNLFAWNEAIQKLVESGQLKNPEKRYLYFAYGSNLNKAQMMERCPTARPLYRAKLFGATMVFKYYADVELDRKNHKYPVEGAIYEITKNDMDELDIYEGYPDFYRKVKVRVMLENGNTEEVFMYVMNKGVREVKMPSNGYFNCIARGYEDWAIKNHCLFSAWERTALRLGVFGEENKSKGAISGDWY